MQSRYGIEVGLEVTGNAETTLKRVGTSLKNVQEAGSKVMGVAPSGRAAGPSAAIYDPQRLSQLRYQKIEDQLQRRREKIVRSEEKNLRVEGRAEQLQLSNQTRMLSTISGMAMNPMMMLSGGGAMQMMMRGGFALRGRAVQYSMQRQTRMAELVSGGQSSEQAMKTISADPKMAAMALKAAMAHPIAALAIGAASAGILSFKASQWNRQMVQPFRGGIARMGRGGSAGRIRNLIVGATEDVAGFGVQGTSQFLSNLQYRGYGGDKNRQFVEDINRKQMRQIGEMSQAFGVGAEQAVQLQNLFSQSTVGQTEGIVNIPRGIQKAARSKSKIGQYYVPREYRGGERLQYFTEREVRTLQQTDLSGLPNRVNMQRDVMARIYGRNRGNMPVALGAVTQIGRQEMAITGDVDMRNIADMVAMFGGRHIQQTAQVVSKMSNAMRGAVGAGDAKEQFFMRAFGGEGYQDAVEAMEGGMTTKKYKRIKEQLETEGYRGFGMHMRMRQLGLFGTTLQAKAYEKSIDKYDKKYGVPKSEAQLKERQAAVDSEMKKWREGMGGYGKWAAKIEAKTIETGLLVINDKKGIMKILSNTIPGMVVSGAGTEIKLLKRLGFSKVLEQVKSAMEESKRTTKNFSDYYKKYNSIMDNLLKKAKAQEAKEQLEKAKKAKKVSELEVGEIPGTKRIKLSQNVNFNVRMGQNKFTKQADVTYPLYAERSVA